MCDLAKPLEAFWSPSPNFGARRDGQTPSLVVIHYTAMVGAEAALARLCDPEAEVSAHYLISKQGRLWQMVAENQRAWHAGAGEWRGQGDVNSHSIGIELDNSGDHPFPEPQMTVLERLLTQIQSRWEIAPDGVIGHSDMAPGRKVDPGPRFDWGRLARRGLARQTPAPCSETARQGNVAAMMTAIGYSSGASQDAKLQALRLRHAPMRSGPLCDADIALLQSLAEG